MSPPRDKLSSYNFPLRLTMLAIGTAVFCLGELKAAAIRVVQVDVVVYGGTSGGVAAAVQASRLGKKVALLVFDNHVGGMSSSGLGKTDIGNAAAIGGISHEFYSRLGQYYGLAESWTFEPHVAENTFNQMLQEANVSVYFHQQLATVEKNGLSIVEITMTNGTVFRAKMFIDTSYEGDLMAQAGVSYFVGREANSVYGETLDGVRATASGNGFTVSVDPYTIPGNTNSGLLPLMQSGDDGVTGSGDQLVQAYCFRMCLTQNTTNFIPIAPPANYDTNRYELLARYIEALVAAGQSPQLNQFFKLDTVPDGKTDSNNDGGFSTDYIGFNYAYPEADYSTRAQIWQDHQDYVRGFFTFLATSPRVPAYLRTQMQSWGLPKDEFIDNGGWPRELYVREARRMVSDYVMTENICRGYIAAPDSVGLAAYNMDSHNCRRIVKNGAARNEGDTQVGVSPYPISYRAIIPKTNECSNLLVPFCLSASHIAFGSIRTEPVCMILGQSAGTAACFAIDDGVPLQQLNYEKLQLQLQADQQVLQWNGGSSSTDTGIILDNTNTSKVTITGAWMSSTSVSGYYGTNYIHDGNTGKGTKSARFSPTIPASGTYAVYLRWTTDSNRATNVPVDVIFALGTNTFIVNQQNQNGQWVLLGNFPFNAGTNGSLLVRTTGTSGYVIADAARFDMLTNGLPTVNLIATDAQASEWQANAGWFTAIRAGSTNSALTVNYTVSGTAANGVDYSPLNGSVAIPAGSLSATIPVLPTSGTLADAVETVALNLSSSANYNLGAFTNAVLTLNDLPYDAWKKARFTPAELADPNISGDSADPDHDGQPNLVEYALGLNPKVNDGAGVPSASLQQGHLTATFTRAKAAVDVSCTAQISSNLFVWNSGTNYLQDCITADDGTNETHMVRDIFPVRSSVKKFIRLQVTRP